MQIIEKLVTNGKPTFGQFKQVNQINYLDADVTDFRNSPLSRMNKELKTNQFCFFSINHDRYILGCAVVHLKLVSNCFIYVYDKQTNTIIETNKLSPIGLGTKFSDTPNKGEVTFSQGRFKLKAVFKEDIIQLSVKSEEIQLQANIIPSKNPMCLCTRSSYKGWVYMQKQTALSCSGTLTINNESHILTANNSSAGIDWTLGYMARETFWNWTSINTTLEAGCFKNKRDKKPKSEHVTLGLNLVCGVNETSYTENALWLDDVLYNMPLTIFDYDPQDIMQPWKVHSNQQVPTDRNFDLVFTPKGFRNDHTDVKALASHFTQLVGTYSGVIELSDQTIELDEVWGLAEDHYAKW